MKYLLLLLFFQSFNSYSNDWIFVDSIKVSNDRGQNISIDKYQNLYISDQKGIIYKLDSLGHQTQVYSPSRVGEITVLEAWNSINIFSFYRDYQSYSLIDRFLTKKEPVKLPIETIGFARLMSLATDQNYWVIDEGDFSLLKIGYYSHQILLRTPLDLLIRKRQTDFSILREYQNQLFLVDATSGVYVFDNMGNFKRKILFKEKIISLSFDKDKMYLCSKDSIFENNIYRINSDHKYKVPIYDFSGFLKSDQNWFFIKNNFLFTYKRR